MSNITYPGINTLDLNLLSPVVNTQVPLTALSFLQVPKTNLNVKSKNGNLVAAIGTSLLTDLLSNGIISQFGDSEFGRGFGSLFSSGLNSAGNTITNNLLKGLLLTEGLGRNTATSLAGTASGLAANYIGRGINALGGDSMLSRGLGQGVATGLGTVGGQALSNLVSKGSIGQLFGKGAGMINPYGLAMTVAGSALGAAFGPSKEYGGEYGNITKTMDSVYDVAMAGANFIPGAGLVISGAMALNKGLSNIFGSTDGMTKQDAILGSAFMPAPVKWLNMAGAKTTGTFNNLSWQNTEKTNSFMGNAFGNLGDKFDQARREAGKTYGTFSRGSYRRALRNLDFANNAWDSVLAMADLNELLNIRSLYMTSINNQRYAQIIQGGWNPIYRGKLGMKILNNATNHNMGMRLLSAAALIDDKQMILSAQGGTKVIRPKVKSHGRTNLTKPSYMTEEEWNEYLENRKQFEEYKKSIEVETNNENLYTEEELKQQAEWNAHLLEIRKLQAEEQARKLKLREKAAAKFNLQANLIQTAMNLQANETPFTGLEYQQAAEDLRQKKVEKFHEAEKIGEATLMADLAVSAAPLLLRGFRWAFNKAGLLVKVPKMAYSAEVKSPYYKIGQDGNLTFDTQNVISQIKSGKQDFINEMLSPEYAEAAIGNMEEAGKMGLSYTPVFEKAAFKSLREDGIIPKFVQDPKHTWHARTGFMGGTPGKATEIEYNISHPTNIRYSTSHESGHVSRWGMGESKSELLYMKHKANQIFKDDGDVGVYEFGSLTGEGATNMRDLGKDMGITLRTPYPGYEKALEMLKNAEKTSNKGGIVKVLKLTKDAMPHIWRALQGLHFEYTVPTVLTATTLYNTNK